MIEPQTPVTCKHCGAAATWATTNNGKRTLLDEAPSSEGNVAFVVAVGDAGGQELAVALNGKALTQAREKGVELREVHFLTCPNQERRSDRDERRAA